MASTRELWIALRQQAALWAGSPVVNSVCAHLPRNGSQKGTGVPGVLQELKAGFGGMMSNPLRLGGIVPMLLQERRFPRSTPIPADEMNSWLAAAMQVEQAHRQTVAWFRSRLPGYPLIRAPHLVAHSPLTTQEWTSHLTWTPEERRQGLQFRPAPPKVSGLLSLKGSAAGSSEEAARDVVAKLGQTDEWIAFGEATRALDDTGKADLRSAREHLTAKLAPDAIDSHEPDLAMPRGAYRVHVTRGINENLRGTARAYTDAFTAVNDLIDLSASEVFGQLMAYGDPLVIPVAGFDLLGGQPLRAAFEIAEHYIVTVDCGSLVHLDDPLISEALRIDTLNLNFALVGEAGIKVEATVLIGTASAF